MRQYTCIHRYLTVPVPAERRPVRRQKLPHRVEGREHLGRDLPELRVLPIDVSMAASSREVWKLLFTPDRIWHREHRSPIRKATPVNEVGHNRSLKPVLAIVIPIL